VNTFTHHSGLLYAKRISSEGRQIDLNFEDPNMHKSGNGILWLHMCAIHPGTREFLINEKGLDELVVNALLAEETRPRILMRKQGVMVIVRAMNMHNKTSPEDMISLRMWIDGNRIITTRRRDILAIEDLKNIIEQDKGPKTTGEFLTMISDRVYARMEPYLEDLEECVSRVEELLALREVDNISENIGHIRIRTAIFRRYVIPQKTVLEELIKARISWLTEENIEHLVESHDRVTRYVETLNDNRERAQIINDEIDKLNGAKLNSMTYMFSVAATIFLPLTFLTGLLGINIGGMPGVDRAEAFWVFTFLCVVIVIMQIMLFKKLKWF
jgi:zinc transporter